MIVSGLKFKVQKLIVLGVIFTFCILNSAFLIQKVFAHVVVKPTEVGVAKYQTFTVSVPNEKSIPVTAIRLTIPGSLESISPNVKPGWLIQTKTEQTTANMASDSAMSDEESPKVTEINWTGGSIPAGLRDEFLFSAKTPSSPGTLIWKAYQTYADGTVVAWDLSPNSKEAEDAGPFSETKIINDLQSSVIAPVTSNKNSNQAIFLSLIAIALSAFSLSLQLKKK